MKKVISLTTLCDIHKKEKQIVYYEIATNDNYPSNEVVIRKRTFNSPYEAYTNFKTGLCFFNRETALRVCGEINNDRINFLLFKPEGQNGRTAGTVQSIKG